MNVRSLLFIPLMVSALAYTACSSKPPHVQNLPEGSNAMTEIERSEELLKEARARQVDVLSPENYTDASKSLEKARKLQKEGKGNSEILEQVAYSRGWLNEANRKTEIIETAMKDITDARSGALAAGAPTHYEKDWRKANKDLTEVSVAAEKGDMTLAEKNGAKITARFRELEVQSITKANLAMSTKNLEQAKKQNAEKSAPQTYRMALLKKENAERVIKADPRNRLAIRRAAEDANRESSHLMDVMGKIAAGNTEELVLMAERQQRTISSLRSEKTSTEQELQESQQELSAAEKSQQELKLKQAELAKSEELLKMASKVRNQFKPNEAEVYAENGKLKIRLRTLQFPSGQASLGPKNEALLSKVQTALSDIKPEKIIVEGHTDATGQSETNKMLSEKRAQTVSEFLISKGVISGNKVEAVGKGAGEPISDNESARGRAENRRIDMVIETK